MDLVAALRATVIKAQVDLSELDEAYRDPETVEGLKVEFRLNWTRDQKERQRELQRETLEVQHLYQQAGELVGELEAWRAAMAEADRRTDENWEDWAAWWAEILLMSAEEVKQVSSSLPEQHWAWLTNEVAQRAAQYEAAALKKADG